MKRKTSHLLRIALLLLLVVPASCRPAAAPASPPPAEEITAEDMLQHYAPVINQGAASDQDFITRVDYDGDWVGNNNWEHQPQGDLTAYVYATPIETASHWYLFYALYHPRDYTAEPCEVSDGCHENDMEALQVVVRKDSSAFGRPQALLTLAHNHIYLYRFDNTVRRGTLKVEGAATLDGSHPVVWVEAYGHGIYGKRRRLEGDVLIYRLGEVAEWPAATSGAAHYRLLSIYDTLWQRRTEIGKGKLFDQPFIYRKHVLPASFDGDNFGVDKANAPWGYNQEIGDVLHRGDFFLDPARAFRVFASIKGELSTVYISNPYLEFW